MHCTQHLSPYYSGRGYDCCILDKGDQCEGNEIDRLNHKDITAGCRSVFAYTHSTRAH